MAREIPEALEKCPVRGDDSHVARNRFHDHTGELAAMSFQDSLDSAYVVKRGRERMLREIGGNSGTVRDAQGRNAGAGLYEQGVRMPMVAAFKFKNSIATGIGPCQPDRAHHRFGP